MNENQRTILAELTKLAGQIVFYGAIRVKIRAAPTVRGKRVFLSMEPLNGGEGYDVDKPIDEIHTLLNKITVDIPSINADVETEVRQKLPPHNQKGVSTASVWRTRSKAVFLVFSKELSETEMVSKNRFKIARDKSNTSIIYLIVDSSGDKPTMKSRGRTALTIKESVCEWFIFNDYEVDTIKLDIRQALRLTAK